MHSLTSTAAPAAIEAALVAAWARHRPAWTRTDTARWINERSAATLAWLRRTEPGRAPSYSRQMGYWLKERAPEQFSRIHDRLMVLETHARAAAALEDVT